MFLVSGHGIGRIKPSKFYDCNGLSLRLIHNNHGTYDLLVIIIPYLYYYLQVQDILCNIITD